MEIKELIEKCSNDAIVEIKDDLFNLYKLELFAKQLYLGQIRKLEGQIIITLKELSEQEELHAYTLKFLLNKIGFETKDNYETVPDSKINLSLKEAIKLDLDNENSATINYSNAIKKSNDKTMKELLLTILNQEEQHVERLKKFMIN